MREWWACMWPLLATILAFAVPVALILFPGVLS